MPRALLLLATPESGGHGVACVDASVIGFPIDIVPYLSRKLRLPVLLEQLSDLDSIAH